jgi:hypothetical protein
MVRNFVGISCHGVEETILIFSWYVSFWPELAVVMLNDFVLWEVRLGIRMEEK